MKRPPPLPPRPLPPEPPSPFPPLKAAPAPTDPPVRSLSLPPRPPTRTPEPPRLKGAVGRGAAGGGEDADAARLPTPTRPPITAAIPMASTRPPLATAELTRAKDKPPLLPVNRSGPHSGQSRTHQPFFYGR